MYKGIIALFLGSIIFLSACALISETDGEKEIENAGDEKVQNEETQVNDIYLDYSMKGVDYSIPESWEEVIEDERLKYYYPRDGMLMVSFDGGSGEETITDELTREIFLKGLESGFNEFDFHSEEAFLIQDSPAYLFNFSTKFDDVKFKVEMVAFDYADGMMNFMMATPSDKAGLYNDELVQILKSLEFTPPEKNIVQEVEESESVGSTIVLGEPIELGDYTIVIQGYRLSKDYDGNDALVIKYDWTNNSDETKSPVFTFIIKGFQDGIETDDAFMVKDADVGAALKDVRPGGTLEGVETTIGISDMSKPLELELDELISFHNNPYTVILDLSDLK